VFRVFLFGWFAWMVLLTVLLFPLIFSSAIWYVRMRRYLSAHYPLKWQQFKHSGSFGGIPTNYRDWSILKDIEEEDKQFSLIKHKLRSRRKYFFIIFTLFCLSMAFIIGATVILSFSS
jgi:hypothetical protein